MVELNYREIMCRFIIYGLTSFLLINNASAQSQKARLMILADMGNEPDEEQQMVHMIMYSNEIDLEGLIAVSGKYLHADHPIQKRRKLYPELFHNIINAYEQELPNLERHAEEWPNPDYLHSIVSTGQPGYGVSAIGPGKSTAGSEAIARAAEKDDSRPLYLVINAGSNTLAQALIDYEATHTREEVLEVIERIRVFENGAQDNAGAWICARYPSIHWVRSNVQTYCYGGPDFDRKDADQEDDSTRLGPHTWQPYDYSSLGQHQWALEHIKGNHGRLGRAWPLRQTGSGKIVYLEGGGTIPWMGLIHRGLSDINFPHWGGWSGRFTKEKIKQVFSKHESVRKDEVNYGEFALYTEAIDRWIDPEEEMRYHNNFAPVWRWRQAMYNDFACRMDWCIKPFAEANHNPIISIDGDAVEEIDHRTVSAGAKLNFDASTTTDPDGDQLVFSWWIYHEAGSYQGAVSLEGESTSIAKLTIPDDAQAGEIHLILEVKDNHPTFSMYDYRRIVVHVE